MKVYAIFDIGAICCGDGTLMAVAGSREKACEIISALTKVEHYEIIECDLDGLTEQARLFGGAASACNP